MPVVPAAGERRGRKAQACASCRAARVKCPVDCPNRAAADPAAPAAPPTPQAVTSVPREPGSSSAFPGPAGELDSGAATRRASARPARARNLDGETPEWASRQRGHADAKRRKISFAGLPEEEDGRGEEEEASEDAEGEEAAGEEAGEDSSGEEAGEAGEEAGEDSPGEWAEARRRAQESPSGSEEDDEDYEELLQSKICQLRMLLRSVDPTCCGVIHAVRPCVGQDRGRQVLYVARAVRRMQRPALSGFG